MRWDYDPKWRDMFDDGVHRDILIVPHATKVTKVPGGPPRVQSKVPKFYDDIYNSKGEIVEEGARIPGEYEDVEWTITNENIIQEKFELADGLCSNDKLTFGSCEAAMVKFTIRNTKTYNEETGRYEPDIPNLQTIDVISEDGRELIGELQGSAIINVYTYVDGDSDSLMWLGMYKVEQDKVSGNGYEREIIAYDFMLTFRDMDIFYWYKALFDGADMDSEDPSKGKSPYYPKYDEWTIGEALKNLFDNFAYASPSRPTTTNPKDYLLDMDADKYPGYGMPILIDPDIWDMTLPAISVGETEDFPFDHERYGGMKIMDLPFRKDEKIIKKQALSCGKFLEDIAALAGRFGCIRKDIFVDDDYIDPDSTKRKRYNTYEKCFLTFRPLPNSESPKIEAENYFDDSDIEKGIQYEHYDTREVKVVEVYDYGNNELFHFAPKGLTQREKTAYDNGDKALFNIVNITENMFTSYIKKDSANLKAIMDILQGEYAGTRTVPDYDQSKLNPSVTPVTKTITYVKGKALLRPGFDSMVNRPYRPYQLSTSSDLCRMPGDLIKVKGYDKITGEPYEFVSFILVRRCTGIQKQMDKYTAKGDSYAGTYSDYRAGDLNDSFHPQSFGYGRLGGGSGGSEGLNSAMSINGLTEEDFIEIQRNDGIRYLDEPSDVSATWDKEHGKVVLKWTDPVDIEDWKPHPAEWEGTVVVRKEGSRPLSRYAGSKVVNSTTRDQYSTNGYEDSTVESNKKYYYAFMPYFTTLNDSGHKIRRYRWTKCIEVDTGSISVASEITKLYLGRDKTPWDGSEIAILWCGNSNALTAQISNSHIVFKMYIGNTEIYSFTSPVGSTVDDASKINVSFLKDDILQLAKPSFIYKNGSTYSYNQEIPTNAQMASIYEWLLGNESWDGSEIDILWSGNNNKLTVQISSNTILFKLYTGSTAIYSFTSPVGSGTTDINKIYAGFLVDTTNEIAKPSFFYDAGSSSIEYNQEEPTDAQMADIYTWLSAGLPSS